MTDADSSEGLLQRPYAGPALLAAGFLGIQLVRFLPPGGVPPSASLSETLIWAVTWVMIVVIGWGVALTAHELVTYSHSLWRGWQNAD